MYQRYVIMLCSSLRVSGALRGFSLRTLDASVQSASFSAAHFDQHHTNARLRRLELAIQFRH